MGLPGGIFARFTVQDSGCVAWGVEVDGARWFVKVFVEDRAQPSFQRALALHGAVTHPAIIPLADVITAEGRPALVYPWVDGEVLYGAPTTGAQARTDPAGPHARFRALPVPEVIAAIDAIYDAHVALAAAGFVAVDLYDGCFIYDFAARRMHLCDLDEYRPGPFTVSEDRLPGSTRFMAPEELVRGGTIDERTTVFDLGRTAQVLLDEGDLEGRFRGGSAAADVLARATRADPAERFTSVATFVAAWIAATRDQSSAQPDSLLLS